MLDYMDSPKNKLTLGTTVFECDLTKAKVTRQENGFDQATIAFPETDIYPSVVTAGTAVKLEVTDEGTVYPTNPMFKGTCRFPLVNISDKNTLTLSCLGSGYGLGEMLVGAEYGTLSSNPTLSTITTIINDASNGIIAKYVNKDLVTAAASGFSYDTSLVDTIAGTIPYVPFPYKPALNSLNDLVDIVTALKAGSAGPHWIVTTDDKVHLKTIGDNQASWTKYFSGSTNTDNRSTLTFGEDYKLINSEVMQAEANMILYYGVWRRPNNGDSWTENNAADWGKDDASITIDNYTTRHVVGVYSIRARTSSNLHEITIYYPGTQDAAWNFSGFTDFNTPNLNFYLWFDCDATNQLDIRLCTDASNYYAITITPDKRKWVHYSFPIGPFFTVQAATTTTWSVYGSPDWSNINYVWFWIAAADQYNAGTDRYFMALDGLYFGEAPILRVAYNSNKPGGTAKMRLITDNTGKDDSLIASDDTGLMAQLAYAELLRQQKTTQNITVQTQMFAEALPGQLWSIQATDLRTAKLIQTIDDADYTSTLTLTDDLINGRSRQRYDDVNKVYGLMRPEWQDRQASSIKAGTVDTRIVALAKDYPT